MFHSFLVQDIFDQFYLRSSSMNFRDTFCKGFTWDPIQKELHIGFYFGPGSSWMLLEIILDFTWDPVQKELYLKVNIALDSCQWTLLGNNSTEECSGWSWNHLQWTLCENSSHDLLAKRTLQEHQCFLSDSAEKVPWISDALLMRFCTFGALLVRFWCPF